MDVCVSHANEYIELFRQDCDFVIEKSFAGLNEPRRTFCISYYVIGYDNSLSIILVFNWEANLICINFINYSSIYVYVRLYILY